MDDSIDNRSVKSTNLTINENKNDGTNISTHHKNLINEDDGLNNIETLSLDDSLENKKIDDVEDEDDEDNEPKFTYDRIRNDFIQIIKDDSATCLTVFEKFFAIGTQLGKVFIFDFQGNIWLGGKAISHRTAINQISIDNKGEFIASASDHRVVISELYSGLFSYSANHERPVKAIAIDPNYAVSSAKRFVIGELDRLLLFEKNIFSRYKVTCLQQARGVIRSISWRNNFIAWSSDLCIKIYDAAGKSIITHIDREKESDYRIKLDLYQCSFCWKDDLTLLIAWGNFIKMCCIKQKSHQSELSITSISSADRMPKYYVELVYAFSIENSLTACGIAPFDNQLIIMCTNKSIISPNIGDISLQDRKDIRIKMVEPLNADRFNNISNDILSPKEFLKTVTKSRDISLSYLAEENFYFILCPKDLILAKPREEGDHINWLIERGKFVEALNRVTSLGERKCYPHSVESVGTIYIIHLLSQGTIWALKEASKLCSIVCGTNQVLWEREVIRFKQVGALRAIAEYLPIGPELILEPALYELVLKEYLETDSQGFLDLIRQWPPSIYSTATLIKVTIDQLSSQSNDRNLLEALAELYTYECRYRKALFIFLQVGNAKKVFDLIWSHQLLPLVEDRIIQLLELDPEETSRLLIINQDSIPADKVINRLSDHPRLLCAYLDRLIYRDPTVCSSYHDLLFDLYSTYEPNKLVPFLRQSNHIKLDKALEVCKKRNLTQAIVFILGRMGNTHEALRIITEKTDDINAAIEFCKEHGDSDLWAELMDISVCKPQLLSTLLREVGTYATDPIGLIERIPKGLEVPDLIPSLVKILQDYRLQVTLENGCRRVLQSDYCNLLRKLRKGRFTGVSVHPYTSCQICQRATISFNPMYQFDLVVFQCGHVFHQHCFITKDNEQTTFVCLVCSQSHRRTWKTD